MSVVVRCMSTSHLAVLAAVAGAGLGICPYCVVMSFNFIHVLIGKFRSFRAAVFVMVSGFMLRRLVVRVNGR